MCFVYIYIMVIYFDYQGCIIQFYFNDDFWVKFDIVFVVKDDFVVDFKFIKEKDFKVVFEFEYNVNFVFKGYKGKI